MRKINLKIPLTFAFLVCFVVVALTANNRNTSVPVIAGANGRPVVVIDAGHGETAKGQQKSYPHSPHKGDRG
jgi:hypothetical protein